MTVQAVALTRRVTLTIDGRAVRSPRAPPSSTLLAGRAPRSRPCATGRRSHPRTRAGCAWSRSRAHGSWCRRARVRSTTAWSCAPIPTARATARRLVLELLGSSVDLSLTPDVERWNDRVRRRPLTLRRRRDGRPARQGRQRRSTSGTTPSASSATSASMPAASSGRTRSPSAWRGVASTPTSPPSSTCPSPTRPASTAATASQVCPTGALMFSSEHASARRAPGTRTLRPRPTRSARSAVSGAR